MARKAPRVLSTVSALEGMQVRTEDGRHLGRVFEVCVRYSPTQRNATAQVMELHYGTSGLLEQLGIRRRKPRSVAWKDVVAISDGAIVVRG
jgi:sporulation protein YlmC with PRC-barrel domain